MTGNEIRHSMILARDEYINIIKDELLGPGSEFNIPDKEHELISSSPLSRYSIGILFPQGNLVEQDNDETMPIGEAEEATIVNEPEEMLASGDVLVSKRTKSVEFDETADENLDEEISMATQFKPSSMGITFLVKGSTERIYCDVKFATYRKARLEDCMVPYEPENPLTYTVPSEVSHFMRYDKEKKCYKLITGINSNELRRVFEQDTIPENEYQHLKNVAYRLSD